MNRMVRPVWQLSGAASSGVGGAAAHFPVWVAIVPLVLFLTQLATGTSALVATCFTVAVLFGLLSAVVGGGLRSFAGVLNFLLIAKFLLVALILKACIWQASDQNLWAPRETSIVMALGFAGVFVGTLIYRTLPPLSLQIVRWPDTPVFLKALAAVVCPLGFVYLFLALLVPGDVREHFYPIKVLYLLSGPAGDLALPLVMIYLWRTENRRFLMHPLVLVLLSVQEAMGFMGASKQGLLQPVAAYILMAGLRYGFRKKIFWGLVIPLVLVYAGFIYPFAQIGRGEGVREGTLMERSQAAWEVASGVLNDSAYRNKAYASSGRENGGPASTYWGVGQFPSFTRFAMVGEADRLVAMAPNGPHEGESVILYGLAYATPKFLLKSKPTENLGNYFSHISRDTGTGDYLTQVSYGFMATLYSAMGMSAVFVGSVLVPFITFFVLKFWVGEPRCVRAPSTSLVLYTIIVLMLHHSYAEAPFTQVFGFSWLILLLGLQLAATFVMQFLPPQPARD